MPLPLPVRFAALTALGLWCAGCSRDAAPAAQDETGIPQTLIVPAGAKPLQAGWKPEAPAKEPERAPSLALQASMSGDASPNNGPRIVELGATPEAATGGLIRQPGGVVTQPGPTAPPVKEPVAPPTPAAESLRSAYVPLSVPAPATMPAETELPQLPRIPNFSTPTAPPPPGVQSGPYVISQAPQPSPAPSPYMPPPVAASQPAAPPAAAFTAPTAAPRTDGMNAVAQQAQSLSDRGLAMAQRGMLFAGRAELIKALQLIAQALDVQEGGNVHAAALSSGLTALEEARDFAAGDRQPGAVVDVASVARTHRTPLLKTDPAAASCSPVVAQQQYFGHAQGQLVVAAGGQPVASFILYRLGRLQTALASHDAAPQALHGPQAMVYHQAALAIDANNYLAANELGVLLARYGQLDSARELLVRSVTIRPQVESWHNLSVVHRRLGEEQLARQADRERELLAQKSGGRTSGAADLVRWVDPRTFAAAGGGDVPWPENTAAKPAAAATGQRR